MTRERVVRFVRRGRARLEALRLLREMARGALAGGAVGLAISLASLLGLPGPGWLPWACAACGAIAGAIVAALGRTVSLPAAALFLDERLSTDERLVTVVTREPGPHSERLLRQLEGVSKLPRFSPPREVSLVPAALFLLFAIGLLPRANGESPALREPDDNAAVAAPDATAPGGVRPPERIADAVRRLAQGQAPSASEVEALRRVIQRRLLRPEERADALAALDRAAQGDAAAAKQVAQELKAAAGGRGPGESGQGGSSHDAGDPREAGGPVDAYPEHRALVLAYRRALAEEENR